MNGITVPMAIVDFIPVVLFFIAAVILQRDLYNKMVKGAYSLLAAGSIMVLLGGFYKALWKALYALKVCDFVALDQAFFPLQGPGFILICMALAFVNLGSVKKSSSSMTARSSVPILGIVLPYTSNIIFIIMQVIGYGGICFFLARIAKKMKVRSAVVLFILAFVFVLAMGYLGAKFDDSSSMHWIAQLTNIIGQGSLFLGVYKLHKAGLGK